MGGFGRFLARAVTFSPVLAIADALNGGGNSVPDNFADIADPTKKDGSAAWQPANSGKSDKLALLLGKGIGSQSDAAPASAPFAAPPVPLALPPSAEAGGAAPTTTNLLPIIAIGAAVALGLFLLIRYLRNR